MAVTEPGSLVLRFADLGVATYGALRVVGQPERTVTWVVEEPLLLAALADLDQALPEPLVAESTADALRRAWTTGAFATMATELTLASHLGDLFLSGAAWQLLSETSPASPTLFVSPSARLARVPWGLLVRPADGSRLLELADVVMAVPANIVHSPREPTSWAERAEARAVLVLDPRVPNQRPDSDLGSVLGRPAPDTVLTQHFGSLLDRAGVLPEVASAVELFRRTDADRGWLAGLLAQGPSRLLYVGHASVADSGIAEEAALHLADVHPITAADLMSLRLPMPPRVALLACASGGDYRFDEATGLVAAIVLGGAQVVTATLWSLPTTAGYRRFAAPEGDPMADPMAEVVIAVDEAHQTTDAVRAINTWQRAQLARWREGDATASPIYWAALVTFAVDGAR